MRPLGPFLRPVFWGPALGLLALIVALAAPVLFASPSLVLSDAANDVANYFLHTTAYVARSLAAGEIPFWNPHVFAGIPFVGGFQSAVFYPGTLLFLGLPGDTALNVSILLHVFLAGAFAMGAVVRRGGGAAAASLAGAVVALGGPLFPHVWGGHLTLLWAYPWTILALAAMDALLDGGGRRAAGVASLALGLGLLAGHPQTVFHTAVAALVWALIRVPRSAQPMRAAGALTGAAALGIALAAVQLWPAAVESPWGLRDALPADQAASFSLPVENLLTLLAPGLFGGGPVAPYWGRAYFWEMSLFVGVVTLPLVVLGATRRGRGAGALAAVAAVLLLLALGANGPLFAPLHGLGAGFDRIRGWSKFSLPLAFFLALLAAEGVERVRAGAVSRGAVVGAGVAALLVAGAGVLLAGGEAGAARFAGFIADVQAKAAARGETWLPAQVWQDPGFAAHAASAAARQLLGGALALALAAGLLALARRRPGVGAATIAGVGVLELAAFAAPLAVGFDPTPFRFEALRAHLAERGATRVLNVLMPNAAMTIGAREVGGYDPGVPRRTAEVLQFSQGRPLDALAQHSRFESAADLFTMFRLGTVVFLEEGRLMAEDFPLAALAQVSLRERFEVVADRDTALARLADPAFDAATSVLLEGMPEPSPAPGGAAGTASVVAEGNGELVIAASVPAPALLLVTDAYHPLWVAEPLPGSAQERYEILPANRCLRAVPLGPGEHRIRMVYRVPGFAAAVAVSVAAAALLLALLAWPRRAAPEAGE